MSVAELAKGLDTDFRASCARRNRDEPWFGHFTLQSGGERVHTKLVRSAYRTSAFWIGAHPLARAYYEAEPRGGIRAEQRGFTKPLRCGRLTRHTQHTRTTRPLRGTAQHRR